MNETSSLAQTKRILSPSPPSPILSNNVTPKNYKTPHKWLDSNNKIFEKNIFSPSFKSKLTSVIRQLTVQPPNQAATQNTRRDDSNKANQTALNYSIHDASLVYYNHQSDSMYHATSRLQEDKESNYKRHDLYDSKRGQVSKSSLYKLFYPK